MAPVYTSRYDGVVRWLIALLLGCGAAPAPVANPAPAPTPATETASETTPAAPVNAIPEIEARVILADMFRAAGYRIVYDVPLELGAATVAIDGFDPEARVGFEYRAADEQAAWDGALPEGAGVKLLVIGPADRDTVEARGQAFLAAIAPAQPTE